MLNFWLDLPTPWLEIYCRQVLLPTPWVEKTQPWLEITVGKFSTHAQLSTHAAILYPRSNSLVTRAQF